MKQDKPITEMTEAEHHKKMIEFERWLNEYKIGVGLHGENSLECQFETARSKAISIKGSHIDKFSFNCGAVLSVAHLHPDVLEQFVKSEHVQSLLDSL